MVYNIFGSCTQTILGKTKTRGVYFEEKSGVFSLKYQVIGIVEAIVIFIAIIYRIFSAYETRKTWKNLQGLIPVLQGN
jgi:hypothetical protein